MIGVAQAVKQAQISAAWSPLSACPDCNGAGGWYWDAPIYHNERQREWLNCPLCCGGIKRVERNAITGAYRKVAR